VARSLWPREHGVYVEVSLPLLTGLVVSPSLSGAFVSMAVVMALLIHEPLLVLTGGRGRRKKAEWDAPARARLRVLTIGTLAAGSAGFLLASQAARLGIFAMLSCGLVSLFIALRYTSKTLLGELLVAMTFSLAFLPLTLTEGESNVNSWVVVGIWTAVFWLQTLNVHAVKSRDRILTHLSLAAATTLLVLAALGAARTYPVLVALGGPALVTLGIIASRTGPKGLRRVGWLFACADVTALLLIVWGWPH